MKPVQWNIRHVLGGPILLETVIRPTCNKMEPPHTLLRFHWAAFTTTSQTETSVTAANRYGHHVLLVSPPIFFYRATSMKTFVCIHQTIKEKQAISLLVSLIQQEEVVWVINNFARRTMRGWAIFFLISVILSWVEIYTSKSLHNILHLWRGFC